MDTDFLRSHALKLGIELSEGQLMAFDEYEARLYEANSVMNLTRVPRDECGLRHFLDSLLISPLIPQEATIVDIGTGPGLPAWPLARARPDLMVTAIDSSGKMLGFLQKGLLPNLEPVLDRMENTGWVERFDLATGRAVAPLAIQLELSAACTRIGGAIVPMRSAPDRELIEALPRVSELGIELESIETAELADTGILRIFPVYRKTRGTRAGFPRPWAEIKRNPIVT